MLRVAVAPWAAFAADLRAAGGLIAYGMRIVTSSRQMDPDHLRTSSEGGAVGRAGTYYDRLIRFGDDDGPMLSDA